jgi:hypothetical protein
MAIVDAPEKLESRAGSLLINDAAITLIASAAVLTRM